MASSSENPDADMDDRITKMEQNFNDRLTKLEEDFEERIAQLERSFETRLSKIEYDFHICIPERDHRVRVYEEAFKTLQRQAQYGKGLGSTSNSLDHGNEEVDEGEDDDSDSSHEIQTSPLGRSTIDSGGVQLGAPRLNPQSQIFYPQAAATSQYAQPRVPSANKSRGRTRGSRGASSAGRPVPLQYTAAPAWLQSSYQYPVPWDYPIQPQSQLVGQYPAQLPAQPPPIPTRNTPLPQSQFAQRYRGWMPRQPAQGRSNNPVPRIITPIPQNGYSPGDPLWRPISILQSPIHTNGPTNGSVNLDQSPSNPAVNELAQAMRDRQRTQTQTQARSEDANIGRGRGRATARGRGGRGGQSS